MNEVYHQYNDFEIISICIEDALDSVKYYARMYDFLFLMDADQSTWMIYLQSGFTPLFYVLEPNEDMIVHGWTEVIDTALLRRWIEECIGVEERPGNSSVSIQILPNPARDQLNITAPFPITVELFTTTGKMVLEERIWREKVGLDLAGLPEGVYLLRVKSDKEVWLRKVVVIH
ncbi:hypothetical protein DRP53_09200 [candidate division WOR-3 bacterium]|uniref:Secretion system C-terminal sorting domain-containing protein n=1 Tax=candidate division WOR-3 bacterium TaxID=2052148 RepID=A0A660SE88_UNCW3|nr:MAG: hypothetical protein DRP53_09200 [candidate division WOR-3 bacterium]